MTTTTILDEVAEIMEQRGQVYGPPNEHWSSTAAMWTEFLGFPILPDQIPMLYIIDKLVRMKETPQHHDSLADIIGYAAGADGMPRSDPASVVARNGGYLTREDVDSAYRGALITNHEGPRNTTYTKPCTKFHEEDE